MRTQLNQGKNLPVGTVIDSGYTHRVAISSRCLVAADANAVTFKYKDYRLDRAQRFKTMTIETGEFIRRFLSHMLPKGFHRIRHYGLLANSSRTDNMAKARELLALPPAIIEPEPENAGDAAPPVHPCPGPSSPHASRLPSAHTAGPREGTKSP